MLQREEFKLIGHYAGMSAIQGGPGLPILTEAMYSYMVTDCRQLQSVKGDDENLPPELKTFVTKVCTE